MVCSGLGKPMLIHFAGCIWWQFDSHCKNPLNHPGGGCRVGVWSDTVRGFCLAFFRVYLGQAELRGVAPTFLLSRLQGTTPRNLLVSMRAIDDSFIIIIFTPSQDSLGQSQRRLNKSLEVPSRREMCRTVKSDFSVWH